MEIQIRQMRREDIAECVRMVSEHPVAGPRYGSAMAQLGDAWVRLLGQEAFLPDIFDGRDGLGSRPVALGVRVFVSDDFIAEMKTPPHFWVGPELVKRILAGRSPVLSDRQVRDANTRGGLNLLIWESQVRMGGAERQEIFHAVLTQFIEHHKGYRLKELLSQGAEADVVELQLRSGGFLLEGGSYTATPATPAAEILKKPHCLGVTRELALAQYGTWISSMFVYRSPRFGFRPSEQRLLLAALPGGTDQEVSRRLGISMSAVKKNWRLIYERVARHEPNLVPDACPDAGNAERGKTKKQRLLAYLRDHMEELRPASK